MNAEVIAGKVRFPPWLMAILVTTLLAMGSGAIGTLWYIATYVEKNNNTNEAQTDALIQLAGSVREVVTKAELNADRLNAVASSSAADHQILLRLERKVDATGDQLDRLIVEMLRLRTPNLPLP